MADLTVYQGLLKSWNIDHLEVVEREKIIKKAHLGGGWAKKELQH